MEFIWTLLYALLTTHTLFTCLGAARTLRDVNSIAIPASASRSIGSSRTTRPLPMFARSSLLDRSDNCNVEPYNPPPVGDQTFPPFDPAQATIYRYRQQQSVNLGSWFVHEQWMTPSVFACAAGAQLSEIDIASGWGSTANARAVLERHWDTFITRSDFQYLSSIGINTVRMPIGFWSLGPKFCQGTIYEPVADVYQNSWERVVRAINMAGEAGIGVLVDLHGAPGSQNGQQHSGVSDGATHLFNDPSNMNKTISVLRFLTKELADVTNVVGIQILNEPQDVSELPHFYSRAIGAMRKVSQAAASLPLYLHDGFNLRQFSDFIAKRKDFIVEDHHSYFVFTPDDKSKPASQHITDIRGSIAKSYFEASSKERRNLVIDEWSCALTDDSLATEADPVQARRDFCSAQIEVYTNTSAGWGFWAYDKEDCSNDPGWCFKSAVGTSLPPTFFSFGQTSDMSLAQIPSFLAISDMPSAVQVLSPAEDMTNPSGPSVPSDAAMPALFRRRDTYDDDSVAPSYPLHRRRLHRRDGTNQENQPPKQRSSAQGYLDGFLTVKVFAAYGLSRLGFTGQYISDSIAKLGPNVIAPGTEENYVESFMHGLADGEKIVRSHVNPGS